MTKNILVVDDEPIIGTAFQRELGDKGYDVDCVLCGEDALKAVKEKSYDLVFIDKVMPGMDGVETCREINKASPGSILIFMTGHFDKESSIKEAQFIGAGGRSYYLYKPFARGELLETVSKALKDKK